MYIFFFVNIRMLVTFDRVYFTIYSRDNRNNLSILFFPYIIPIFKKIFADQTNIFNMKEKNEIN